MTHSTNSGQAEHCKACYEDLTNLESTSSLYDHGRICLHCSGAEMEHGDFISERVQFLPNIN
jgi:predicted sulfurtransferase